MPRTPTVADELLYDALPEETRAAIEALYGDHYREFDSQARYDEGYQDAKQEIERENEADEAALEEAREEGEKKGYERGLAEGRAEGRGEQEKRA